MLGVFKRNGRGYAEIVPGFRKATLQVVIRERVGLDSVIYSHGWRGYDGLMGMGCSRHLTAAHGPDEGCPERCISTASRAFRAMPKAAGKVSWHKSPDFLSASEGARIQVL